MLGQSQMAQRVALAPGSPTWGCSLPQLTFLRAKRTHLTLGRSLSTGGTWVAVFWRGLASTGVHFILAGRRNDNIVL